ncbi:MAG: DUF192 domain-containing protein [Candidatus Promineifilaceae bacterium]|nr:DUF192 domain-containing protein [Candidatus Promineifilaceae bacterium]
MEVYRKIVHVESGRVLVERARWCNSFTSKLRGFLFERTLDDGEGLVLVEKRDSRMNTTIHMLFVFVELGVVWVNGDGEVVDAARARPWRLSYTPQAPARYVIETHPDVLHEVTVGDHVRFEIPE